MKATIIISFLLLFLDCFGQIIDMKENEDTLIYYYDSGEIESVQVKGESPNHISVTYYYKNGQIESFQKYENRTKIYAKGWHETGEFQFETNRKKSGKIYYVAKYKNGKLKSRSINSSNFKKLKVWFANGKIQLKSLDSFKKTLRIEFDSLGAVRRKTIGKNGVGRINCSQNLDKHGNPIGDKSCFCFLGNLIYKDSVWYDTTGRDVSSNYTETDIKYFQNGVKNVERTKVKGQKKYFVREWDINGKLINEYWE